MRPFEGGGYDVGYLKSHSMETLPSPTFGETGKVALPAATVHCQGSFHLLADDQLTFGFVSRELYHKHCF